MRIFLSRKMARACAASAFVLLLDLAPDLPQASAHSVASVRRAAIHRQALDSRGQSSWSWRSRNVWNRGNRAGWGWNQAGLEGFGYWSSPFTYASPVGDGTPVVIGGPSLNILPPQAPASFDPGFGGGCVIHKLVYDGEGKFMGERQIPHC